MTELVNGLNLNITTNYSDTVRFFGWIPLIIVSAWLMPSVQKHKLQKFRHTVSVIGVLSSIMWAFAILTQVLLYISNKSLIYLSKWTNKYAIFENFGIILRIFYHQIDIVLYPSTNGVIVWGFFVLALALGNLNHESNIIKSIVNSYIIVMFIICNYFFVTEILDNYLLIVPLLGFVVGAKLSFNGDTDILPLFKNSAYRGLNLKRQVVIDSDFKFLFRVGLLSILLFSYLYSLTIAFEVQIAFYSAAIAGLMAVVGFSALVFSFSFDQIKITRLRRKLSAETSDFQGAALPAIVASIIGLVISRGELSFALAALHLEQAVRLGIALCAFSGLIFATYMILRTFREITLGLSELQADSAVANVYIEETSVQESRTSLSSSEDGLSEFCMFLEDEGCIVNSIIGINEGALKSIERLLLIVPQSMSELPENQFEALKNIAANGAVVWIMTDHDDWKNKISFFKYLGLPDPIFKDDAVKKPVICLKPGAHFGRISGSMSNAMTFPISDLAGALVGFANIQNTTESEISAPVVAVNIDYGWLVVSTDSSLFINSHIATTKDTRFVHDLFDAVKELFLLGHNLVSCRMINHVSEKKEP